MSIRIGIVAITVGLIGVLSSCTPNYEHIALELSPIFSDHMVLQQEDEVAFFGNFTAEGQVTVSGSWGAEVSTYAIEDGTWNLLLPTPSAGGPFDINIVSQDSTIAIGDVMIGEVWLASGQSNMEMPVRGWLPNDPIDNSDAEVAAANFPSLRMFTVQRNFSVDKVEDVVGDWQVASPETAGDFSATAYFFARRLHQELNVPIGIIHSSWGGTLAEAWTSESKLRTLGDFDEILATILDPETKNKEDAWYSQSRTEDLPSEVEDWTKADFGDGALAKAEFVNGNWRNLQLPGRLDEHGSTQLNGVFWVRKSVDIQDTSSDYTLSFGAIDDGDQTFFNGELVGSTWGHLKPRSYTVPQSLLRKGSNFVAVKAIDTGGQGSISGEMLLSNTKGQSIDLEGEWSTLPVAEIARGKVHIYDWEVVNMDDRPSTVDVGPNTPTSLYNAMIDPLLPYTIKGAIWYQGESNVARAEQYERLFPAMIQDWRTAWDRDFPFYFVQIAPYRYGGASEDQSQKLRDAQRKSLATSQTGMVVTMDIGNFTNIHPANKQDVGGRLAGLALANDYDKDLVPSGPLYKSMSVTEDGRVAEIEFDFTGSGLMSRASTLSGFEIAGSDGVFHPASASITGDKVRLVSNAVAKVEAARYAWLDNGVASLFNNEGLPASSFSTQ